MTGFNNLRIILVLGMLSFIFLFFLKTYSDRFEYLFGNSYQQNSRHFLNEDVPHPGWHPMCGGLPVMDVQDNGGKTDADRQKHHGE